MQFHPKRGRLAVALMSLALAVPAAASAQPRLPDGLPDGYSVPTAITTVGTPALNAPADNQAYEFGNCQSRQHASGGWVCSSKEPTVVISKVKAKKGAKPTAHAAGYNTYNFNIADSPCWGVGSVQYGCTHWIRWGYFNGQYININQEAAVTVGAHAVRYEPFTWWHYRSTSVGWEYRTGYSATKPSSGYTRSPRRMVENGAMKVNYNSGGYDYFDIMFFHLRDGSGARNPSTGDGLFYSPNFTTRTYHCVTNSCWF